MRILGIDFGDARTGVALSDPTGFLATGLENLRGGSIEDTAQRIITTANAHGAQRIVLGYPKNMDGSIGPRAQKSETLKTALESLSDLPVILWDERQSTVQAQHILRQNGKKAKQQKNIVDSVAAVIILQSYLDSLSKF